jgi:membrane protease YdiL (CAAX protease family)
MGAAVNGPGDEPANEPEPRFVLGAGSVVYGGMALSALAWLWLRGRLEALPERAIGDHGPFVASGLGLAVGWLAARLFAAVNPRVARLREIEAMARRSFERASDAAMIGFVTLGALAEELFFRLAVQDAFGLAGSVALCAVVNSSLAGWAWLPVAGVHALALGLLVQQGFGLLGSTTASAVMNYLNLRRIQCS